MPLYNVLRQHLGDKMYMPGDERDAAENDVAHLVTNGVLAPAKAERAPANKAEGAAPLNQSEAPAFVEGAENHAAEPVAGSGAPKTGRKPASKAKAS